MSKWFKKRDLTKGEQTKAEILDHAFELFATLGYQSASIQKIADAATVSQSTVLFHFKTKINLFKLIVAHIIDLNMEMMEKHISPQFNAWERLLTHFKVHYLWVHRPKIASILIGVYYMSNFDEDLKEYYKEVKLNAQAKIESILLAGQREGIISEKIETSNCSKTLHEYLIGCVINNVLDPKMKPRQSVPKHLLELWKEELARIVGLTRN